MGLKKYIYHDEKKSNLKERRSFQQLGREAGR